MRCDLHVHSSFSRRPSTWLLKKIGCAESYTAPREVYRIARERGMDFVTITDHNTIDGALEIADRPGAFVSTELTSYFPEDRCKIHVLVYDITEEQFREMDQLRGNVYDLVAWLRGEGLFHALAHPFFSVNDRLTVEHFEKCLLIFDVLEQNGNAAEQANEDLRRIVETLGPQHMQRLADRHGIAPALDAPWSKAFIGGSDDHSSLQVARVSTHVPGALGLDDFLNGAARGLGRVRFEKTPSPQSMAHHLYGVAYQFYTNRFRLPTASEHNLLMRFLDRMLQERERRETPRIWTRLYTSWRERRDRREPPGEGAPLVEALQHEARRRIARDPELASILENEGGDWRDREGTWFRFLGRSLDAMLGQVVRQSAVRLAGANPFDLFNTLGSAGALYTLAAPYFISYAQYAKDRRLANQAARRLLEKRPADFRARVGHFTDTLDEINGVARTLEKHRAMALETGKDLTLIACRDRESPANTTRDGVRHFTATDCLAIPEYEEQRIFIPPLLEVLQFAYDRDFTHIHGATPGPIGLCGLLAARMLKRPFFTTYHTSFPQYALHLTDDPAIEEIAWRFMLWFYDQSTLVFAPSNATIEELASRGIDPRKIRIMPRGVDSHLFHPDRPAPSTVLPDGPRILYVGRVSKEKNLHILSLAFREIHRRHPKVHLVVVGDGPYLKAMKQELHDLPAVFTGYLAGEELAGIYAACDLFVFPSTTDTFGNVVLEAQASGLPVVVTDVGGPHENLLPGKSGVIVAGNNPSALSHAVSAMLDSPDRLRAMGAAARQYAETRDIRAAFEEFWASYEEPDMEDRPGDRVGGPAQASTPGSPGLPAAPLTSIGQRDSAVLDDGVSALQSWPEKHEGDAAPRTSASDPPTVGTKDRVPRGAQA